jgi:O-acetyl-ADP-ribose deacetylase
MDYEVIDGDLLDQRADVIVNAWNRNVIPWWLLLPQGVSGAIKRRAGLAPFRELGRLGPIPLGGAVLTGAGRLPYAGIIHVAGIDMLWRASMRSICDSVRNALALAETHALRRVALPVIGAGSGGFGEERALGLICETLQGLPHSGRATVVRFRAASGHSRHVIGKS